MPRDVTTRWNSTYDMLEFAIEFREALDTITGDKEMKLRKYEMDSEEWEIAHQLRDVLKVSIGPVLVSKLTQQLLPPVRSSRTQLCFSREIVSRTWQPLFPLWDTLTMSSLPVSLTSFSAQQFVQH